MRGAGTHDGGITPDSPPTKVKNCPCRTIPFGGKNDGHPSGPHDEHAQRRPPDVISAEEQRLHARQDRHEDSDAREDKAQGPLPARLESPHPEITVSFIGLGRLVRALFFRVPWLASLANEFSHGSPIYMWDGIPHM